MKYRHLYYFDQNTNTICLCRLILRDRFGPTDEIAKKRMRTSAPAATRIASNLKGKAKAILAKKKDTTKNGEAKTEVKEDATTEESGEKKPSEFDEIPQSLLICKVCQKTMRDASVSQTLS